MYFCVCKIGCICCFDFCLIGVIIFVGDYIVVDVMVCVGCGSCFVVCFFGVIFYDVFLVDYIFRCF